MSKCPYPFIYVYEALCGHLGPLLLPLVNSRKQAMGFFLCTTIHLQVANKFEIVGAKKKFSH